MVVKKHGFERLAFVHGEGVRSRRYLDVAHDRSIGVLTEGLICVEQGASSGGIGGQELHHGPQLVHGRSLKADVVLGLSFLLATFLALEFPDIGSWAGVAWRRGLVAFSGWLAAGFVQATARRRERRRRCVWLGTGIAGRRRCRRANKWLLGGVRLDLVGGGGGVRHVHRMYALAYYPVN